MTTNEIRNLIEKKLVGQGSMIDVGGVLPAVLLNLLDLIEEGGGGTSDAVQYIPQELTSPQQMQARKNQGLYYSEGTPAGTITWDGNTEGKESIDLGGILAYKVANTPKDIPQDAWLGYTSTEDLETTPFTQIVDYGQLEGAEGKMLMGGISGGGVVIVADQFSIDAQGLTVEADGIYFTTNVRSFSYDAYDGEIHHIEPKYIKDMYYEESGTGEKTVESVAAESPTPAFFYDNIGFYKASSDTPSIADIKKVNNNTIGEGDLTAEDEGDYTIYTPSGATETQGKFIVVYESTTIDYANVEPGLYYPSDGVLFARPYLTSVTYIGDISVVHQIPAKYIPQTIPVVRMEIPSNDNRVSYGIGHVLLNNYVSERDVVFSIEGKTINQVAVRNMLDTTSTGNVWDFGTGNTYNFDTSGYYLVEIEVQETPSSSAYYYATVFVETVNM